MCVFYFYFLLRVVLVVGVWLCGKDISVYGIFEKIKVIFVKN